MLLMDGCPMDFQGPWLPMLFVLFSVYLKKVRARDLQARSTGHDLTVHAMACHAFSIAPEPPALPALHLGAQ